MLSPYPSDLISLALPPSISHLLLQLPGRMNKQYREAPGGSSHGGSWVDCEPAVELAPVSETPFHFSK